MPDTNISARIARLDALLESEARFAKERHEDNKQIMEQILTQARSTNGRLGALESWKSMIDSLAQSRGDLLKAAIADIEELRDQQRFDRGRRSVIAGLLAAGGGIVGGALDFAIRKWQG